MSERNDMNGICIECWDRAALGPDDICWFCRLGRPGSKKQGGPFGGETGGDVSSSAEERRELRSTPGRPLIVACIDPWAEVKP